MDGRTNGWAGLRHRIVHARSCVHINVCDDEIHGCLFVVHQGRVCIVVHDGGGGGCHQPRPAGARGDASEGEAPIEGAASEGEGPIDAGGGVVVIDLYAGGGVVGICDASRRGS